MHGLQLVWVGLLGIEFGLAWQLGSIQTLQLYLAAVGFSRMLLTNFKL
jgi:hypothetical protein